jgi:hypothetical protein
LVGDIRLKIGTKEKDRRKIENKITIPTHEETAQDTMRSNMSEKRLGREQART